MQGVRQMPTTCGLAIGYNRNRSRCQRECRRFKSDHPLSLSAVVSTRQRRFLCACATRFQRPAHSDPLCRKIARLRHRATRFAWRGRAYVQAPVQAQAGDRCVRRGNGAMWPPRSRITRTGWNDNRVRPAVLAIGWPITRRLASNGGVDVTRDRMRSGGLAINEARVGRG